MSRLTVKVVLRFDTIGRSSTMSKRAAVLLLVLGFATIASAFSPEVLSALVDFCLNINGTGPTPWPCYANITLQTNWSDTEWCNNFSPDIKCLNVSGALYVSQMYAVFSLGRSILE